jgi:pimeloyl-ACP methyl ester carboxylesterase
VQPFRYRTESARVADFTQRLAAAHRLPAAADPQARLGIAPHDLERLRERLLGFDWSGFEARVNEHPAFSTTTPTGRLHFVHARSADPKALPLLLLHGWPGSFLEFRSIIGKLNSGTPAFHVVCPSLPGYAFSTRSLEHACDTAMMADSFADLMERLGYATFLVQGGDWGSLIACQLARRHPERCRGLHLNFTPFPPPAAGDPALAQVATEESAWVRESARAWTDAMGYYVLQGTRPQTLAVALADSPLGLLAWLGEKHLAWSDRDAHGASCVADEAIADHVALYWLTGSIGSSMRLYYDERHTAAAAARIEVPCGVAVFPRELLKSPRAWVMRHCNLIHWSVQPRGGHFAALEVPELLLTDVRGFGTTLLKRAA